MRISDIILKKRNGKVLTKEEIEFFVNGYTNDLVPDYQASALLMAIYFRGMNKEETLYLTEAMANSGDKIDLSAINGIKVDKHSTGGVGDKISICLAPMVAAAGSSVAKMSGRGLGHTGGTIDKLESIEGLRLDITEKEFIDNVNNVGMSIASQTGKIAPADKKIYALRDVTATVDNMSLIAASIMSKKLASGADGIVLDVKMGSGAFMKTKEDANALANAMVDIGEGAGKQMVALVTNMDEPLGHKIGNSLEVIEAIEVLNGNGPSDVEEIALVIGSYMLLIAKKASSIEEAREKLKKVIEDKSALAILKEFVKSQGGNENYIDDTSLFEKATKKYDVKSKESGFIKHIDSEQVGRCALMLGAGRENKNSKIDLAAGIDLRKKVSDFVNEGETIATLYYNNEKNLKEAISNLLDAYEISKEKVEKSPLILDIISKQYK